MNHTSPDTWHNMMCQNWSCNSHVIFYRLLLQWFVKIGILFLIWFMVANSCDSKIPYKILVASWSHPISRCFLVIKKFQRCYSYFKSLQAIAATFTSKIIAPLSLKPIDPFYCLQCKYIYRPNKFPDMPSWIIFKLVRMWVVDNT